MDRAPHTSRAERSLIHNPNHPPRPSPSYPSFNPPPQHPVPQQPAFDPFQRRDPFMPAQHAEKRDTTTFGSSYGSTEGRNPLAHPSEVSTKDVIHQSQPPPHYRASSASIFGDGDNQRKPTPREGFSEEPQRPQPPSSSLFTRHMPPPSNSPSQASTHTYQNPYSREAVVTPPASRDGFPAQRQSNNMSIQSIMGLETSTTQPSSWSNGKLNTDVSRPPHTPDRTGAEQRSQPGSQLGSPEYAPSGMSRLLQPFSASSPRDTTIPPRPFSQPAGSDTPRSHLNEFEDQGGGQQKRKFDEFSSDARHRDGEVYRTYPPERTSRDRASSDLGGSRSHKYDLGVSTSRAFAPREDYGIPQDRGGPSPPGAHHSSSHFAKRYDPEPISSNDSAGLRHKSLGNDMHTPEEFYRSHPDPYHPQQNAPDSHYGPAYNNTYADSPTAVERPQPRYFGPDQQLRKSIEEAQLPFKPMFNAQAEAARRMERGSPLPQAVQGASAQPVGSGRDPGIKTEFGRMFSGLGSGIGSTPQPPAQVSSNGPPTPLRQSPNKPHEDVDTADGRRNSGVNASAQRVGLQNMANPYDGIRAESGSEDRASPVLADGKGNDEPNEIQALHHHHHHHGNAGHHHHHHHLRPEEETTSPHLARRISGTPMARTNSSQLTHGPPHPAMLPHHHHHLHPHHHHHHLATPNGSTPGMRPQQPQSQPVHRPTATVKTIVLLSSYSHLPRKHLGSQLYSPQAISPSNSTTPLESKFPFSLTPNPLPRFDGKENCTFTVRIPRTYLSDRMRELVIRERRVWGTDVYTDDSDPLGAAMHAGWIRGAWSEDVDVAALDLDTSLQQTPLGSAENGAANDTSTTNNGATADPTADPTATHTEPPSAGPVIPPANYDMHLTLLILPTLEHYASSVWHGIKSRTWGTNHDGLSFKIHKIEWIKEGDSSRFEERGGKAKKKRLAAMMAERKRVDVGGFASRKS